VDSLPDFSNSKILVMNRIEGAIRERKKRPNILSYFVMYSLFLFTTACTVLFLKNILFPDRNMANKQINYYNLEKLLLSEQLNSDSIIELPESFSFSSFSESKLISKVDYTKGIYE